MKKVEEVYDPEKQKEIENQTPMKYKQSRAQLKKLALDQSSPFQQNSQQDDQIKTRRTGVSNQKGYYEESNLEGEERAKKYWRNLDTIYFKEIQLNQLRDTLENLLEVNESSYFLENEYEQQNHVVKCKNYMLEEQYPKLKSQRSNMKVLFQNEGKDPMLGFFKLQDNYIGYDEESSKEKLTIKHIGHIKVDGSVLQSSLEEEQYDIDQQIILWEKCLQRIVCDSRIEVQKLKNKMLIPKAQLNISQEQIKNIKDKLYWSTILKLFIQGHKDKTPGVFEYYNITGQDSDVQQAFKCPKEAKKFQTDCKICFCSSNYESNIVVYCDSCNTSFHVICYGLENIPKSQKYYCEVCVQFKLVHTQLRPNCKICQKKYFPMKKLGGHYYHVTCLVLNNLIEFKNLELVLRKELTWKMISRKVIESQMLPGSCAYCESYYGMRFNCAHPGCPESFHPICGYLNGVKFDLKKSTEIHFNIEVKAYCHFHDIQHRNYFEQVYFRRYVCNYKKTSELTFQQFQLGYKRQLQGIDQRNRQKQDTYHEILSITNCMRQNRQKVKNKNSKMRTEVGKLLRHS